MLSAHVGACGRKQLTRGNLQRRGSRVVVRLRVHRHAYVVARRHRLALNGFAQDAAINAHCHFVAHLAEAVHLLFRLRHHVFRRHGHQHLNASAVGAHKCCHRHGQHACSPLDRLDVAQSQQAGHVQRHHAVECRHLQRACRRLRQFHQRVHPGHGRHALVLARIAKFGHILAQFFHAASLGVRLDALKKPLRRLHRQVRGLLFVYIDDAEFHINSPTIFLHCGIFFPRPGTKVPRFGIFFPRFGTKVPWFGPKVPWFGPDADTLGTEADASGTGGRSSRGDVSPDA